MKYSLVLSFRWRWRNFDEGHGAGQEEVLSEAGARGTSTTVDPRTVHCPVGDCVAEIHNTKHLCETVYTNYLSDTVLCRLLLSQNLTHSPTFNLKLHI